MNTDEADEDVAAELYARRKEAIQVRQEQVRLGDWTPERQHCHENVDYWVAKNQSHKAVPDWLVGDHSFAGFDFFYFSVHSAVEMEDGALVDITPSEPPSPFLRHIGTDEAFEPLRKLVRLQYPPLSQLPLIDFPDSQGGELGEPDLALG